ncbi:cytochrome c oxidase accessory protein CcoG [Permianibacter aggregans]|uniref:Cytochrome c oxidase accessory protein FixG n=1 Tax=Permianibacter aggregans TaxID=1510150 RepID=A0A4R6UJS0_9GAMM|nr:cytochrome c oxidase accessory protein FixG [Permianibacter aggregans]
MTERIPVQELYVKPPKIYPKKISGVFAKLRTASMWLLLGWYYLAPWLTWNDRQAILFDLPNRKFHLFGLTLWPQDFIFLSWLLILAALSLFFFTALAGRLWCGYACPQTVWTKAFLWMERITEGDRNARMRLDKAPLSIEKIRKKTAKHTLWILFALATGYTFVGYFVPIRELSTEILAGTLGGWAWFWVLFYSFATYGNAGKLREQVCIYMCPYARFQGAMFDRDTLVIAYDPKRGEPRGARKRDAVVDGQTLGDCIDCKQCVHVCPTGIDIRDGLQIECIACAACIDACDEIMDKMSYPRGLIRYTTERNETEHRTRIMRPRILIYGALLFTLLVLFVVALSMRSPLRVDILKDRGKLYSLTDEGLVENIYTLKIMNLDQQPHQYMVRVEAPVTHQLIGDTTISVESGAIASLPLRLRMDPYELKDISSEVRFIITDQQDQTVEVVETSNFVKPGNMRSR